MAKRGYLWTICIISLLCTIAAGAGFLYLRGETPSPVVTAEVEQPVQQPEVVIEEPVPEPVEPQEPEPAVITPPEEPVAEPEPEELEAVNDEPVSIEPIMNEELPEEIEQVVIPDSDVYYWVRTIVSAEGESAAEAEDLLRSFDVKNVSILEAGEEKEVLVGPYIELAEAEQMMTRLSQIEGLGEMDVKIQINR